MMMQFFRDVYSAPSRSGMLDNYILGHLTIDVHSFCMLKVYKKHNLTFLCYPLHDGVPKSNLSANA